MSNNTTSNNLDFSIEKMLKYDEGVRLQVYRDTVGILTVGVGHNLEVDPALDILKRKLRLGDLISQRQCDILLNRDLSKVLKQVNLIPGYDKFKFKYHAVCVNLAFNMGYAGLLKFKHTLNAMRMDDVNSVCDNLLDSTYAKQLPKRAARMVMLCNGVIPHEYLDN